MKKYLSYVLAAVMSLSAISSTAVFSEGTGTTVPSVNNMVVFGDGIASGYGLSENEFSYAQICADYLGCNLDSFTANGMSSAELCNILHNPTDEQKEAVRNTDVVVISTGANDIVHVIAKRAIEFAAKKGLLNEGFTTDDIPEDPSISDMNRLIDQKAFKQYANSGMTATLALNTELKAFSMDMRLTDGYNAYGKNQGIIKNQIMPNIDESVKAIREINPNAQIIVQTIYQPLQLSPEYIAKNYSKNSGYTIMLTTVREELNDVMDSFRKELNTIEDIEVVDVLQTFTALEDINDTCDATPGYAYYFTDIQEPVENEDENGKTMNFNPNKKGHAAIASALIGTIKIRDNETGELVTPAPAEREVDPDTGKKEPTLLDTTLDSIEDIADCPPLVMEQIVDVIPEKVVPGDVNNDGFVDATDGSLILSEYANLSVIDAVSELDEEATKRADINYDGRVDAADATFVSMYYAYLSTLQEGAEPITIFQFMDREKNNAALNK